MDTTAILNPVFNDGFAGQLANSGHVYIGVGLVLFQLVLIPIMRNLFIYHMKQNKQLIDSERQVTKLTRDNEINELRQSLRDVQAKSTNDNKQLSIELTNVKNELVKIDVRFDRIDSKFDRINDKMDKLINTIAQGAKL